MTKTPEGWYNGVPTHEVLKKDIRSMGQEERRMMIEYLRERNESQHETLIHLKAALDVTREQCDAYYGLLRLSLLGRQIPTMPLILDEVPPMIRSTYNAATQENMRRAMSRFNRGGQGP